MAFNTSIFEINLKRQIIESVMEKAKHILNNNEMEIIDVLHGGYNNSLLEVCARYINDNGYHQIVRIIIDTYKSEIHEGMCQCSLYYNYKNSKKKICEHSAAVALLYLNIQKEKDEKQKTRYENMGIDLINSLKSSASIRERIKLDVILYKYKEEPTYIASFKIGNTKMYVVKSIENFAHASLNSFELQFGKGFTFNPLSQEFDETDEKLKNYIEEYAILNEDLKYTGVQFMNGKELFINNESLRSFLEKLVGKQITLNSEKFEVVEEDIPVDFKLNKKNDMYVLSLNKEGVISLSNRNNVYLYDGKIYLPSLKQIKVLNNVFKYIADFGEIKFKEKDKNEMFNSVISRLDSIGTKVKVDKKINNVVKDELKAEFLLDYSKRHMVLDANFKYGDEVIKFYNQEEETEKIVIRDTDKEQEILDTISNLNFDYEKKQFVFKGEDDDFVKFLIEGYKELEKLGEVFYSDRLKEKKVHTNPNINASISSTENDYLEIKFNIEDIDPSEYKNILAAYKEKRKYYKLKDDSFIALENEELAKFLGFVHSMDSENKTGKIRVGKNKAVVINDYLKNNNLNFVKGKDIVDEISNKILNLKDIEFDVPKDLNATLRTYQVTGYRWFKNLSYLGFGGILADEMGLGKTVQTIAFLLSEKGKKAIIVAPTSLVYNWKKEFNKFAESMKVTILHGNKEEREKVFNSIDEYDVILTTYGTLKNDEDKYKDISFDYLILDEAQNIKNPMAQITKSVKQIVAKNKFVLTGTPIENNLIELWSIFDFVMPGYLESVNKFKSRFVNNNDSVIDLQNYIKPFMLRRLKKDVIKELPEKIEKNHYVELSKKQKKIYASYVEEVKEELKSQDFEGDKITIFSYLTRLRQLCIDPSVVLDNYDGKNSKLEELVEILHENIENNHKILVFSQFTSVLKNISERLNKEEISHFYLDGSTKASQRQILVDDFNKSNTVNVFLISLKAGGTGLNLTSADMVVHFDPWWNPAVEEQATDRAHRIGQKSIVQVIKLISQGTIEDKILNMQEEKKKLINDVLDNNFTSESILKGMSTEELKSLFK